MTPVLTLIDDNGNSFTFEKDFWLSNYNLNVNKNIRNYTYSAGGRNTADGFPQARVITIEGIVWADTLAQFEVKKRSLIQACLKGGKLQYSDDTKSRYINVKDADFSISKGDWRNSEKITISFIAEYPFWVDSVETSYTPPSSTSFSVDASGSDFVILPKITLINEAGATFSTRIVNLTDGGAAFTYEEFDGVYGDVIVIDSFTGTVTKNANPAYQYVIAPWFMRLQPTVNEIRSSGEAMSITVQFRKVYV